MTNQTPVIGPTFFQELKKAGLITLPISWNEDGLLTTSDLTPSQLSAVQAVLAKHNPGARIAPDCQSLPWWRTALKLWNRTDTSGAVLNRFTDVDYAITALETATNADSTPNIALQRQGILAREQFEYASSVLRDDLIKMAPAFRFTLADVDESCPSSDDLRRVGKLRNGGSGPSGLRG